MKFLVRRFRGAVLVKQYLPPLADRDVAERIAQRACEKHPDCVVEVVPIPARSLTSPR